MASASESGFGGEGLGSLLIFWLPSPSNRGERERVRIWGRGAGGEGDGFGDAAQRRDASFGDTLNEPRSGRPNAAPKRYSELSVLPNRAPPHPQPLSPKQAVCAEVSNAFENETSGVITRFRNRGSFGGEGSQKFMRKPSPSPPNKPFPLRYLMPLKMKQAAPSHDFANTARSGRGEPES